MWQERIRDMLQTPSLFAIDIILRNSFQYEFLSHDLLIPLNDGKKTIFYDLGSTRRKDLIRGYNALLNIIGFAVMLTFFLLPKRRQHITVVWILDFGLTLISYKLNVYYIENPSVHLFLSFVVLQCIISFVFYVVHEAIYNMENDELPRTHYTLPFVMLLFSLPILVNALVNIHAYSLEDDAYLYIMNRYDYLLPPFSLSILIGYVLYYFFPYFFEEFKLALQRRWRIIQIYDPLQLFEYEWSERNIGQVFRYFWFMHVAIYLSMSVYRYIVDYNDYSIIFSVNTLVRKILIYGSNSLVSIIGMTCVVKQMVSYVDYKTHLFLKLDLDERKIGLKPSFVFLCLCLGYKLSWQTPVPRRLVSLYKNFCVVFLMFLLHVRDLFHPSLAILTQVQLARVIPTSIFLLAFPSWLLYSVSYESDKVFQLTVFTLSGMLILSVTQSLLMCIVYTINNKMTSFWERLDDIIYSIQVLMCVPKVVLGVVVFWKNNENFWFESSLQSIITFWPVCVFMFKNVKTGWDTLKQWRALGSRIRELPAANQEQLANFNGVCAICLHPMESARITVCEHYFHDVCLGRWLAENETCPLCKNYVFRIEGIDEEERREDTLDMLNLLHVPVYLFLVALGYCVLLKIDMTGFVLDGTM